MRTKTIRAAGIGVIFVLFTMLSVSTTWAQVDVKDRMVERRAIEAAVWGMPIVNFQPCAMG